MERPTLASSPVCLNLIDLFEQLIDSEVIYDEKDELSKERSALRDVREHLSSRLCLRYLRMAANRIAKHRPQTTPIKILRQANAHSYPNELKHQLSLSAR